MSRRRDVFHVFWNRCFLILYQELNKYSAEILEIDRTQVKEDELPIIVLCSEFNECLRFVWLLNCHRSEFVVLWLNHRSVLVFSNECLIKDSIQRYYTNTGIHVTCKYIEFFRVRGDLKRYVCWNFLSRSLPFSKESVNT